MSNFFFLNVWSASSIPQNNWIKTHWIKTHHIAKFPGDCMHVKNVTITKILYNRTAIKGNCIYLSSTFCLPDVVVGSVDNHRNQKPALAFIPWVRETDMNLINKSLTIIEGGLRITRKLTGVGCHKLCDYSWSLSLALFIDPLPCLLSQSISVLQSRVLTNLVLLNTC